MATTQFVDFEDPRLNALYGDVAKADLQPLWMQRGLLPPAPNRLSPHLWHWKVLKELVERAGDLVTVDRGGDRRVLALAHPDLNGKPFATHTLWGAVQYLRGGELAPSHRHSPAALRFVLEGRGVWTLVNGDPILMEPGDLVLTPSWNWHEHDNPGVEPMIWFDGLDLPLVSNLDAVFFQEGPEERTPYDQSPTSRAERYFGHAGLRPVGELPPGAQPGASGLHSPLLVYRWNATDAALSALLGDSGECHAAIRYCDTSNGSDVMPTMRSEMHRLLPGLRGATTRTVGSSIWVVFRGAGSSVIGGVRYEWNAGDIFVVPSWAPVDHEATEASDLFVLSDAPVMKALGLGRSETMAGHQAVTATSS